jgi:hypothetical protein
VSPPHRRPPSGEPLAPSRSRGADGGAEHGADRRKAAGRRHDRRCRRRRILLARRTARAPRPPPNAIRSAPGPSTAPRLSVVSAARAMPGGSRPVAGPPPVVKPNAGEWPPLPGRYRIVNAVNKPHNTNQGTATTRVRRHRRGDSAARRTTNAGSLRPVQGIRRRWLRCAPRCRPADPLGIRRPRGPASHRTRPPADRRRAVPSFLAGRGGP